MSNFLSPKGQGDKSDLFEIKQGIKKIELFCKNKGLLFKKPLLILGTFERVGSNWLLDTLNTHVHTHNEPFKQQLGKESCYSTLSPYVQDAEDCSPIQKNPFARYWLETFVSTKYGVREHVVKETNLFFALKNFIKFFPDAPVLILKREPLGIFSSLLSQDLYTQWHYRERYKQLQMVAHSCEDWRCFQFIFEDSNESSQSPIVILTRLLFLNTLLIAYFLEDRSYKEVSYEVSVKQYTDVLAFLSTEVFPGKEFIDRHKAGSDAPKVSHGTFSTGRTKDTLEAFLDTQDEKDTYLELDCLLAVASMKFSQPIIERVKNFLSYDKKSYNLVGRKQINVAADLSNREVLPAPVEFILDKNQNVTWRNTLVTNIEYCEFLNKVRQGGVENVLDGGQIFFNENMIPARGGRIHFNKTSQEYEVSSGYAHHPVYWVTWIGALMFARSVGFRLPTRAEISSLVENTHVAFTSINAGHVLDDVRPCCMGRYVAGEIMDTVGNVAVWCSDGPMQVRGDPQSVTKYIYGTAWNRPSTVQEITKHNARPIVGNSRSVGIRLVKDPATQVLPFQKLIEKIKKIPDVLIENKDLSLYDKDQALITLLSG